MKLMINLSILLFLAYILSSCGDGHYVNVRPGSSEVNIASASTDLSNCVNKGNNRVRITGYAERLSNYIEEDLKQLSKNAAVDVGANTIVMNTFHENGNGTQSATFDAYLCK